LEEEEEEEGFFLEWVEVGGFLELLDFFPTNGGCDQGVAVARVVVVVVVVGSRGDMVGVETEAPRMGTAAPLTEAVAAEETEGGALIKGEGVVVVKLVVGAGTGAAVPFLISTSLPGRFAVVVVFGVGRIHRNGKPVNAGGLSS